MTSDMPIVTTDPELLEQLEARIDHLTSRDMAAYARSLGLTPPGDGDPPVVLHFPAGTDFDSPGQIVWDMRPDQDD